MYKSVVLLTFFTQKWRISTLNVRFFSEIPGGYIFRNKQYKWGGETL